MLDWIQIESVCVIVHDWIETASLAVRVRDRYPKKPLNVT
jgi:hypothetical protein